MRGGVCEGSDVEAGVDGDVVAGDIPGSVGDEEIDRVRDVLLLDEAAERRLRLEVGVDLLRRLAGHARLLRDDLVHAAPVRHVGAHVVHGDVVRTELQRERPGESADRPLRGGVARPVPVAAEPGGSREVDDASAAARDHVWDHVLAGEERSDHVQLQDRAELLHGIVLRRRLDRARPSGGVHEDVDAAEPFGDDRNHRRHLLLGGDVAAVRQARALRVLLVERRRVALERVEVAADEREVRSVPREMLGDDASDALRGAGDDRDLAREGGGHRCHPRAAGGWSSGTRLPSASAISTAAETTFGKSSDTRRSSRRALGPAMPIAQTTVSRWVRTGIAMPLTPRFVSSREPAHPTFRMRASSLRSEGGSTIVRSQSRSSDCESNRSIAASGRYAINAFCDAPAWRGTLLPGCTERRSGCAVSTRSRQTPRVPPGATTVRSDVSPVSRESLRSTGSASERRSTAACARSPRWSAASPRRKRFVSSCWLTYPRCLSAIRIRWVVGTGRSSVRAISVAVHSGRSSSKRSRIANVRSSTWNAGRSEPFPLEEALLRVERCSTRLTASRPPGAFGTPRASTAAYLDLTVGARMLASGSRESKCFLARREAEKRRRRREGLDGSAGPGAAEGRDRHARPHRSRALQPAHRRRGARPVRHGVRDARLCPEGPRRVDDRPRLLRVADVPGGAILRRRGAEPLGRRAGPLRRGGSDPLRREDRLDALQPLQVPRGLLRYPRLPAVRTAEEAAPGRRPLRLRGGRRDAHEGGPNDLRGRGGERRLPRDGAPVVAGDPRAAGHGARSGRQPKALHRHARELVALQARPRRAARARGEGRDPRVRRMHVPVAHLLGAATRRARGMDDGDGGEEPRVRLRPRAVRRPAAPGRAPDADGRIARGRRPLRVPGAHAERDAGGGARARARLAAGGTGPGVPGDGAVSRGMTRFWHPFADMAAVAEHELSIVRGEGSHIWDSEGRRYLDATASLWYCNIGHGRWEIADAVAAQMRELE